jgi:hypothetical protein
MPVVAAMPWVLSKSFGAKSYYSTGQVERVSQKVRVSEQAVPYAFAAFCTAEKLTEDNYPMTAARRDELRSEISRLFEIDPDFDAQTLRRSKISQTWNGYDGGFDGSIGGSTGGGSGD